MSRYREGFDIGKGFRSPDNRIIRRGCVPRLPCFYALTVFWLGGHAGIRKTVRFRWLADFLRKSMRKRKSGRTRQHVGSGGRGGIRTREARKSFPVFKTGAFSHSATRPRYDGEPCDGKPCDGKPCDGEPGRIRTFDLSIKSRLLYQLSYGLVRAALGDVYANKCRIREKPSECCHKGKLFANGLPKRRRAYLKTRLFTNAARLYLENTNAAQASVERVGVSGFPPRRIGKGFGASRISGFRRGTSGKVSERVGFRSFRRGASGKVSERVGFRGFRRGASGKVSERVGFRGFRRGASGQVSERVGFQGFRRGALGQVSERVGFRGFRRGASGKVSERSDFGVSAEAHRERSRRESDLGVSAEAHRERSRSESEFQGFRRGASGKVSERVGFRVFPPRRIGKGLGASRISGFPPRTHREKSRSESDFGVSAGAHLERSRSESDFGVSAEAHRGKVSRLDDLVEYRACAGNDLQRFMHLGTNSFSGQHIPSGLAHQEQSCCGLPGENRGRPASVQTAGCDIRQIQSQTTEASKKPIPGLGCTVFGVQKTFRQRRTWVRAGTQNVDRTTTIAYAQTLIVAKGAGSALGRKHLVAQRVEDHASLHDTSPKKSNRDCKVRNCAQEISLSHQRRNEPHAGSVVFARDQAAILRGRQNRRSRTMLTQRLMQKIENAQTRPTSIRSQGLPASGL